MRVLTSSVLLLSLVVLGGLAQAREIFVDQKHAQADDKNDGSEAKPVKTIPAAVLLAKPGDVIWVKAGVYEETVKIETSGTANRPITLSAWKDDSVRIGAGRGADPPHVRGPRGR